MSYDPIETITRELRAHGVTKWEIESPRGGHHKIRFVFQGKPMLFVSSASPSDRRGKLNAIACLRRLLGVKRVGAKSAKPRRERNRTEPNITLADLTFTVRPDPFAVLLRLKETLDGN